MPANVQLIAGPPRSGKTQRLLATYRRQLSNCRAGTAGATASAGPATLTPQAASPPSTVPSESFWLAPNQWAVAQLEESLLDSATTALLRPNLSTFAHFADTLIRRSGRLIRPISRSQKRRLLQHAIGAISTQGRLHHFARVAATPGFVLQVDELIADLKRKDIWPEALEQRTHRDRRAAELAHIYADYQRRLQQSELYDTEGRFWAAREILTKLAADRTMAATAENEAALTPVPFGLIVVSGFNDFTESQYDILRLLSVCSVQLTITLTVELTSSSVEATGDEQPLSFRKTHDTLSRLRKTFPQLQIDVLPHLPHDRHSLSGFQHQLFREPVSPAQQPTEHQDRPLEAVEILAANSTLGEVEAMAARIKELLHSHHAQPEEIIVVCQGGEPMAELIAAVYPDYGIPFWSETRPRLAAEPLLRGLSALLQLHLEDWPFHTLLEVINNRMFRWLDAPVAVTGEDREFQSMAADLEAQPRVALEACIRSAQLPSGREALLEQLDRRHTQLLHGQLDLPVVQFGLAKTKLRQLDGHYSALPTEATIDQWVDAIECLLNRLGVVSLPLETRSQHARAWGQLRRGLASISEVDRLSLQADQKLSLPEFRELIATVAREQRLPNQNDAVGRVRILTAESARKLSVNHLLIGGLSEQAFSTVSSPTRSRSEPDELSQSHTLLADMLELEQPSTTDRPAHDAPEPDDSNLNLSDGMLLFYELATRATQSLMLSYPALDAKGQSLPPSPLLTELERSVGVHRVRHRTMALGDVAGTEVAPRSVGCFRRAAVDQALAGDHQWLAGLASQAEFATSGNSILSGIQTVAQRGVREQFGPYEGMLISDAAQAALAQRFNPQHLWSPSQLESYAACPFRFFAEHLLKLEPISELALNNDARRRGSLLHQVLATIHQQLSKAVAEPGAELIATELVDHFLSALQTAVEQAPLRGIEQSLREIERREIEAWAPQYAEQESKYRRQWKHLDEPPTPAFFEVRFGPETRNEAGDASDPASTRTPFEFDLGTERIRLTGQIDRIDVGRAGPVSVFNIIDYKSGKAVKLKLDRVRAGYQLQLPLYALAAESLLLAEQQALALATGYWNIQGNGFEDGKRGALHLRELADETLEPTATWQQLQPDIARRVQTLIHGIRGGEFPVYNEDEQCTRSCSLSTICRVAQIRTLEKTWPPQASDGIPPSDVPEEGPDGL